MLLVEFWPFMGNFSEIMNGAPATGKQTDGKYGTYGWNRIMFLDCRKFL